MEKAPINISISLNGKRELKYLSFSSANKKVIDKEPISLGKIVWVIIVMGITIYLMKSYFLDIPQLVTGKLNYVTGTVFSVETKHKELFQYIDIGNEEGVKFFFSSGVKENKKYKIGYLTNTSRAIYCTEIVDNQSIDKKDIGFPFKDILMYIGGLSIVILLMYVSIYIKWKLFIPACILFYPSYIYLYIRDGVKYGTWFSLENDPLTHLMIGFIGLIAIGVSYFGEKYRSEEVILAWFVVQIVAILEMGMFVAIFIH